MYRAVIVDPPDKSRLHHGELIVQSGLYLGPQG